MVLTKCLNLHSFSSYQYGCSIDCGGTPLRVYERTLGSQGSWTSLEDYVSAPTFVWYNENSDYGWLPGQWLSALDPPGEGEMVYQDSFGVQVSGDFNPQAPAQSLPEYRRGDEFALFGRLFFVVKQIDDDLQSKLKDCLDRCKELDERCRRDALLEKDAGEQECEAAQSACLVECEVYPEVLREMCQLTCKSKFFTCRANNIRKYRTLLQQCDAQYDRCREDCKRYFTPPQPPARRN